MQFGKVMAAQGFLRDNEVCDDAFANLIERIGALAPEERGREALGMSAALLELAAFELAGSVDCEQIGALIECAAKLTEHSTKAPSYEVSDPLVARRTLQ